MVKSKRDKGIVEELIFRVQNGPSFLDPSSASVGYAMSKLSRAERNEIHRGYQLWLSSWVVPQLEELLKGK